MDRNFKLMHFSFGQELKENKEFIIDDYCGLKFFCSLAKNENNKLDRISMTSIGDVSIDTFCKFKRIIDAVYGYENESTHNGNNMRFQYDEAYLHMCITFNNNKIDIYSNMPNKIIDSSGFDNMVKSLL